MIAALARRLRAWLPARRAPEAEARTPEPHPSQGPQGSHPPHLSQGSHPSQGSQGAPPPHADNAVSGAPAVSEAAPRGDAQGLFEDEIFFRLRHERDRAMGLAALGAGAALAACVGLALLLPLREVVPYVLVVDGDTARALPTRAVAARPLRISGGDALDQALVHDYVRDRETYDPADNDVRIRAVLARSDGQARDSLVRLWSSDNPRFPPDRLGQTRITATVRTVTLLEPGLARVRYLRTRHDPDRTLSRPFVATVRFALAPREEPSIEALWANPMGFTVTAWRVDAEALDPGDRP